MKKENKGSKRIIILLSVLLVLSLIGIVARSLYLRNASQHHTITVPDNVIGEKEKTDAGNGRNIAKGNWQQGTEIHLSKLYPSDNERFQVSNMLPGDCVTKYYCIKTKHKKESIVYFETRIAEEKKHLGNVLEIKVTDVTEGAEKEKNIVNGTFDKVNKKKYPILISENSEENTEQYFRIDVLCPASLGNEYQKADLTADFKWYIENEDGGNEEERPGAVITGDDMNQILLIVFVGSAILLAVLLALEKRRRGSE